MQFFDDSLHPENMEKVVITVAPYAPEWMPEDFPQDIPVTMDEQVQIAVDCYEAGATVLHLHVRELDGKGSKRLSKFNELIGGVREAVQASQAAAWSIARVMGETNRACLAKRRRCAAKSVKPERSTAGKRQWFRGPFDGRLRTAPK